MSEVNVTWLQGKQFVGTDSTKHSVVMSSTDEGVGMKPSDLLLVALAGCTSVDVVNILTKMRARITDVRVKVTADQAPEPPWCFERIHIHYEVTGIGLDSRDVVKAIELSDQKYCSVSNTLKKAAEVTWDYEVIELDVPQPVPG